MGESAKLVRGWVRNGVVIPDPTAAALPDGAEVRITVVPEEERGVIPFPPEMQAEFDQWEALGDESWAMIDEWEKEDRRNAAG